MESLIKIPINVDGTDRARLCGVPLKSNEYVAIVFKQYAITNYGRIIEYYKTNKSKTIHGPAAMLNETIIYNINLIHHSCANTRAAISAMIGFIQDYNKFSSYSNYDDQPRNVAPECLILRIEELRVKNREQANVIKHLGDQLIESVVNDKNKDAIIAQMNANEKERDVKYNRALQYLDQARAELSGGTLIMRDDKY